MQALRSSLYSAGGVPASVCELLEVMAAGKAGEGGGEEVSESFTVRQPRSLPESDFHKHCIEQLRNMIAQLETEKLHIYRFALTSTKDGTQIVEVEVG